jgi:hypothetical protein
MAGFYAFYPSSSTGSGGVTSLNTLTGAVTLAAGSGISLTPSGSTITIANTGSGGTVTSVALSDATGLFTISGSPITTAGTLILSGLQSQTANKMFAGPATGSSASPMFRSMVLADMPTMVNNTVLGNASGGVAVPAALTTTQLTTLVNTFTSTLSGAAPLSGGGTSNFLRADGTWAAPTSSGSGFTYVATNGVYGGTNSTITWTGEANTVVGVIDEFYLTSGNYNTFYGFASGTNVSTGSQNTAVGALSDPNATGNYNTTIGYNTSVTSSYSNSTAIGAGSQATGANAVAIGYEATAGANQVALGNSSTTSTILQGAVSIGAPTTTNQHYINTATATPASGVGTLTNMPSGVSGNPAGYIQIEINGNIHYLPYW